VETLGSIILREHYSGVKWWWWHAGSNPSIDLIPLLSSQNWSEDWKWRCEELKTWPRSSGQQQRSDLGTNTLSYSSALQGCWAAQTLHAHSSLATWTLLDLFLIPLLGMVMASRSPRWGVLTSLSLKIWHIPYIGVSGKLCWMTTTFIEAWPLDQVLGYRAITMLIKATL